MDYTSIEQSKKLLELGLNSESADFYYVRVSRDTVYSLLPIETNELRKGVCSNISDYIIPCWSVGALLEVMPEIKKGIDIYYPYIAKVEKNYYCLYGDDASQDGLIEFKTFLCQSLIDACFNMVVWLLENNYIKKSSYD